MLSPERFDTNASMTEAIMTLSRWVCGLVFGTGVALLATGTQARDTAWRTYSHNGTCFMIAYPEEDAIRAVQPRQAYLSLRHVPSEEAWDGIAVVSGMGDITGAKASIEVDGETFPLLVYGEAGYVKGAVEDGLVAALQRGATAKVRWSSESKMAGHTYSLVGFTAARDELDRTCARKASPAQARAE